MKLKLVALSAIVTLVCAENTAEPTININRAPRNENIEQAGSIVIIDMPDTINKQSANEAVQAIWQVKADSSIDGVVIKVNCSGGAAGSSYFIFSELQQLAKVKPVVSFVENCALSGGYMMVAATNYIVACPTSSIGSIGVISHITKLTDLHYKGEEGEAAQTMHVISTGEYKADHNPYTPLEKRALAHQAAISKSLYDEFCNLVANARGLDINEHETWANGKELAARQALGSLIDEIGDLNSAVNQVQNLLSKRGITKNNKPYELKMISACAKEKPTNSHFDF